MKTQSGFTLIEVLIALVILAIGLLGLLGISTATMRAASENDEWTTSRLIGSAYLEQLTSQTLEQIHSQPVNPAPVIVTNNHRDYEVQWWLTPLGTTSDAMQVTVRVKYSDLPYQRPVSLTTLKGFFL